MNKNLEIYGASDPVTVVFGIACLCYLLENYLLDIFGL